MIAARWWTLVAVCAATFMLLVDVTIVQVAVPEMQRDLHATLTDVQWVINAYTLALAALILSAGSLADRFGRKRIFIVGIAVFTVASALCGLSSSALFLIVCRAIQGIGGAAMFATSLALVGQEFTGSERGTAIAVWGATVGSAIAIGPLVGGVVTDALGWQWIFFVNVPVGILAIGLSQPLLVNVRDPGAARLDRGGVVCFSGALFALVFALERGNAAGWTSVEVIVPFVASAVLFALFLLVEVRHPRAMFDLELFRNPAFCGVSLGTYALGAGSFAQLVYVALYLQDVLGYSPLQGGLRMLPMTALVFVVPLASRRLGARAPQRLMLGAGLAATALGLFLMHGIGPASGWTALIPGFVLQGIGVGLANPAIAATALGVVSRARTGMASGISNTFRLGGVATGVAALGALFSSRIASELAKRLPHETPRLASLVAAGGVRAAAAASPRADRTHVVAAARAAFLAGFDEILLAGAIIAAVGAVCALALIRGRDFVRAGEPAPGAGAPQPAAAAPATIGEH